MSENPLTEQEQYVKNLMQRWREFNSRRLRTYSGVVFGILFLLFMLQFQFEFVYTQLFLGVYLLHCISNHFHRCLCHRKFVRHLKDEDKALLEGHWQDIPSAVDYEFLKELSAEYRKVTPETELLRASAQHEDDTLLRIAAPATQDQLLRSTNPPPTS